MASSEAYEAYEASDEASESELLDKSLSVWKGKVIEHDDFTPVIHDIHTASSIGHYEYVSRLIHRGDVEIDKKNKGSWTPLMYASYIGHDNIVKLLIEAGCDYNMKNHKGQTPLMLAASCGNETVGRTLCRYGADLEKMDKKGWTALYHATYAGHQNFVTFLLANGANMGAVEPSSGKTPFHEAAAEGHEIIVQSFLQNGVDVNARAVNGDMARSLALINGHMKVVSLIDNHVLPLSTLRSEPDLGSDLSSSDEAYQRPRHHSLRNSKVKNPSITDGPKAIARLIDRGNPNSCVPKGYVTFPQDGVLQEEETKLSYRDVTSPINPEDYTLDSSGGRDSCDYEDDGNAFSKTGAITIKSSSSSSGGLIAALGLGRDSSSSSEEDKKSKSCDSFMPRKKNSHLEISGDSRARHKPIESRHENVQITGSNLSSSQDYTSITHRDLEAESQSLGPYGKDSMQSNNHMSSLSSSQNYTSITHRDLDSEPQNLGSFKDYNSDKDSAIVQDDISRDIASLTSIPDQERGIPFDYLPSLHAPETPALRRSLMPESSRMLPGYPEDLCTMLNQLGLHKYLAVFDEQDVDLQVFLSLTDNDLKEIGIKLFGPRKKMTNAIARWHSQAPLSVSSPEQCYADRLEGEMQEMAIQLNQAYASAEKLKAQVSQEQQLRSVTESCLMEERSRVHQLSMDSRMKCSEVRDTIKKLKHYHAEIKERLAMYLGNLNDQANDGLHSRHQDMKQGFSLEDRQPRTANDVKALSIDILLKKTDNYLKDIQHAVGIVSVNSEHLINKSNQSL